MIRRFVIAGAFLLCACGQQNAEGSSQVSAAEHQRLVDQAQTAVEQAQEGERLVRAYSSSGDPEGRRRIKEAAEARAEAEHMLASIVNLGDGNMDQ